MPVEEPVEEKEAGEDADVGEVPPTEKFAPEKTPVPPAILLVAARIWASGLSDYMAGQGLGTSSRAWGNAPTIQAE